VVLKVGETAKFADSTVTLVRVFDDSRCPADVTCFWAGTVKVEVKIGVSTSTVELGKTISVGALEMTLLSVTPYPKEGSPISSWSYEVTLRVEKKLAGISPQ
jgi:hypothetical protein